MWSDFEPPALAAAGLGAASQDARLEEPCWKLPKLQDAESRYYKLHDIVVATQCPSLRLVQKSR